MSFKHFSPRIHKLRQQKLKYFLTFFLAPKVGKSLGHGSAEDNQKITRRQPRYSFAAPRFPATKRESGKAHIGSFPHEISSDFSGAGESRYSLPLEIEYLVHLTERCRTQVEEEEKQ
jgi:hypothetical protein